MELGPTAELQARLRHVYWIGGGSGAGKSTIARRVADRHGLRVYSSDDAMLDHGGRYPPQDAPLLTSFMAMDMDERWLHRSPEAMLESFHWPSPSPAAGHPEGLTAPRTRTAAR